MDADRAGRRSDARRNHARLLGVAARAFAAEGPQASLEKIARDSGVGIGTLYRHFPTRESLIVEAYHHEVEQLCLAARDLLAERPADQALREWMSRFVGYVAAQRGLADALRHAVTPDATVFTLVRGELLDAVTALLAAGRDQGRIRPDISAEDLLRAMSGVWSAADSADPLWRDQAGRILDLLMDGLRHGARP